MKIEMLNSPNQVLPVYSGEHSITISFKTFRGVLFATVEVDGEIVIASRRVVLGEDIMGYASNANRFGSLRLIRKYDADITDFTAYNKAIYLDYEPPEV